MSEERIVEEIVEERIVEERIAELLDLQHPDYLGRAVTCTVRISEQSDVGIQEMEGKLVNVLNEVIVQDRQKTFLDLYGVAGNENVKFFTEMFRENCEIELRAQVIQVGGHYALKYISACKIQRALQLVGATNAEIAKAEATVTEITGQGQSLLLHIQNRMVEILGIQNLKDLPILSKALWAVILQAVACGMVNGTPACLHILLVGPPAVGKGLLRRIASLLNAIFELLSSNSVTPAGLCGTSERVAKNRTRVMPGKLVLANHGTAAMEDLQHVDTYSRRHTFGIFCDVMESGRVVRTTFRDIDIAVETALLLDVNPKSTTRPGHIGEEIYILDDIELPLNLLSRIDSVFVIPHDVNRQIDLMKKIVGSVSTVGPADDVESNPRVRDLRVLVAYLRDLCPTIRVDTVIELVNTKLDELLNENRKRLESLRLAGDFLTRGAKTIWKLVAASARLNGRCEATEQDVVLAFEIFGEKMRFLTMVEPAFSDVSDWGCTPASAERRVKEIRERFAGQTVDISVINGMFPALGRRTIIRDMHRIGATPHDKGSWQIPPAAAV